MSRLKVFAVAVAGALSLLVSSPGYGTPLDQYSPDPTPLEAAELSYAETIPYQGNMSGIDGLPIADGLYDFQFNLFESQDNNAPFWSEEHLEVPVANGVFSLQLGRSQSLPPLALKSDHLLLQVAVRGPGEDEYTPLDPPQVLNPQLTEAPRSPTVDAACAHDHFGELWSGDAWAGFQVMNEEPGIGGVFTGGTGIWGIGSPIGVVGSEGASISQPTTHVGVLGISSTGYGGRFVAGDDYHDLQLGGNIGRIYANDNNDSALWLTSNADVWIILDNNGDETSHSLRVKSGGTDVCTIDESGNLDCNGTKSAVVDTHNYGEREMYAIEGTEVWFEDIGSADLAVGQAFVAFDQVFAQTVNLDLDYQVSLTPVCPQPLLLSVSEKTSTGFSVLGVTLDGQPSDCGFDYRVTAKRLGYEGQRLEKVDAALQETP